MNAQTTVEQATANKTTIKARRVNNNVPELKHYTVTNVVRDPGVTRCFGFAVSDDGQTEIYLSAMIIKHEQMTSADVGAGFSCMTRSQPGFDANAGHPHALHPIKWDGEAEEIVVDTPEVSAVPPSYVDVEDFDELVTLCSQLLDNAAGPVASMIDRLDKLTQGAGILYSEAKKLREQLDKFQKGLDTIAPETE